MLTVIMVRSIIYFIPFLFLFSIFFTSCTSDPLPYLGEHEQVDGKTIHHKIPDFSFTNQDGKTFTNDDYAGKAYVADFFFIHCPTICPKVTKNMLRISEKYAHDDRLKLLSFTVDPKRDTVAALANYALNLGVTSDQWNFLTGDRDTIYALAEDYMSLAYEDPDAPGGFDHSGYLLLIDAEGHIRAYATGTESDSVDEFMKKIDKLLAEEM